MFYERNFDLFALYQAIFTAFCSTACITGRFGINCTEECHCKDATEDCQLTNGHCESDCAKPFVGDTCQGNTCCRCICCVLT